MSFLDLKIATIHLFQMSLGILGNFSLIIHYIIQYFHGCRSRPTDVILRHLTVANSLALLSRGAPKTMAAVGMKDFLDYLECNLILYIHRVARSVSIGTTCLLSVFQAIIISPGSSRWAAFKLNALNAIGPSNVLFWALHMLLHALFPIYMTGETDNKTISDKYYLGYCAGLNNGNIAFVLFAALNASHDAVCLGLMSWASSFMVCVLYRHKQQVKYMSRTCLSLRSSPETRASQSILVLVGTFVSFYVLSSIFHTYLTLCNDRSVWLVTTSAIISVCFPTVSPFILISSDPRVWRLLVGRNMPFPSFLRKL